MTVVYRDAKPFVALDHRRITLTVRPGSDAAKEPRSSTSGTSRFFTTRFPAHPEVGAKAQGRS